MDGSLQIQFMNVKGEKNVTGAKFGKVVDERIVRRLDTCNEDGYPLPNRRVVIRETRMAEVDGKKSERLYEFEKVAVLVHGPYTQAYRQSMLFALLSAQESVRDKLPDSIANFSVITPEELEEIRRIWVNEKREFEDALPKIFFEATGRGYDLPDLDEAAPFRSDDVRLLGEICDSIPIDAPQLGPLTSQQLLFRVLREQLGVQHGYRGASRRVGLQAELEGILENSSFNNESEALDFALQRKAGGMELMYEKRGIEDVITFFPRSLTTAELDA